MMLIVEENFRIHYPILLLQVIQSIQMLNVLLVNK